MCKTAGIWSMFAKEVTCQSSCNRMARVSWWVIEENHLSALMVLKTGKQPEL